MENINPAGNTALQPISAPESSQQQPNAPIATDLDKVRSAPASTSIAACSSSPLPEGVYLDRANMYDAQAGESYRKLVEQLARE